MAAMRARQEFDDAEDFAMAAEPQHDAVIGPSMARSYRVRCAHSSASFPGSQDFRFVLSHRAGMTAGSYALTSPLCVNQLAASPV